MQEELLEEQEGQQGIHRSLGWVEEELEVYCHRHSLQIMMGSLGVVGLLGVLEVVGV